jgi:hypothetical protein
MKANRPKAQKSAQKQKDTKWSPNKSSQKKADEKLRAPEKRNE